MQRNFIQSMFQYMDWHLARTVIRPHICLNLTAQTRFKAKMDCIDLESPYRFERMFTPGFYEMTSHSESVTISYTPKSEFLDPCGIETF